ncbi:MAG: ATP-binding protein [Actinomycetota bacterium]|nr:ATP-binding protein [Actinomycetota bacterium]
MTATLLLMQDSLTVCLELDSRPERLTLVRSMLAGVGELVRFDPELVDDLKTVVSEACSNVVLHAYGSVPGPLVVTMKINEQNVELVVRDRGAGIRSVAPAEDRMGVGLALINALADRAELLAAPGGGTEVRMTFAPKSGDVSRLGPDGRGRPFGAPPMRLSGDVVVTLSPVGLLTGVLGRIARALAASARFSLDRFADVYLVTDAIAAHAERAASAADVRFAIAAGERRLELRIGPFRPGSGAGLQACAPAAWPGSALALLADELSIEPVEDAELLRVVLVDRRRGAPTAR